MLLGFIGTLIGLAMLVWGANLLIDSAAGIAKRKGISGHIIGVSLVATATSLPELATAVTAAITGNHGIAVGNIVGSNAFNIGIVLAIGVFILPIFPDKLAKKDGWIVIIATMAFAIFAVYGISRWEALILLVGYLLYVSHLFRTTTISGEVDIKERGYSKLLGMLVLGTALLSFGSPVLVSSAVRLAAAIGVENSIIGLTLIAAGTSLPELTTCVVAAVKGHEGIAVGNILGSNLFNILLIPGIAGLIHPLKVSNLLAGAMIPAMLLVTLIGVILSRKRMSRKHGILLLISYFVFISLIYW